MSADEEHVFRIEDGELQIEPVINASPDRVFFVASRRGHKVHRLREVLANGAARTGCCAILPAGSDETYNGRPILGGWYKIGSASWPNLEDLQLPTPVEPLRRPWELCQHCLDAGGPSTSGKSIGRLTNVQKDRMKRMLDERIIG